MTDKVCETTKQKQGCCGPANKPYPQTLQMEIRHISQAVSADEPCCGTPTVPGSPYDRAGYRISPFVRDFVETAVGPVPRVGTSLAPADILGAVRARLNIGRDDYRVAPGLYCLNNPGPDSKVLVTANYKLGFDYLRRELQGLDAWILVLDTHGVNVWCAAGKGTLSTEELTRRIESAGLDRVVRHRELILPQLAATGISAHRVKKDSGFKVIWGPVRAKDIPDFLLAGMQADDRLRRVTFTMPERLVLIPVELSLVIRPALWTVAALFVLSGIGTGIFSFESAWARGVPWTLALAVGIIAGAIIVPALLPWLPGRSFSLKGMITGFLGGSGVASLFWHSLSGLEVLALVLSTTTVSSYLAMNFTGATPFTSPSGVEKEMRRAIPLQAGALLLAVVAWIASAFV